MPKKAPAPPATKRQPLDKFEILRLHVLGLSHAKIGRKFGVSRQRIFAILKEMDA